MKNKNDSTSHPSLVRELSTEELKEIAPQQNKSIEEVAYDHKHALKELDYSNQKLSEIIESFRYTEFPNDLRLHNYGYNDELNTKYLCYVNLERFHEIPASDLAIVTGFGPTNSPTAGTLSS